MGSCVSNEQDASVVPCACRIGKQGSHAPDRLAAALAARVYLVAVLHPFSLSPIDCYATAVSRRSPHAPPRVRKRPRVAPLAASANLCGAGKDAAARSSICALAARLLLAQMLSSYQGGDAQPSRLTYHTVMLPQGDGIAGATAGMSVTSLLVDAGDAGAHWMRCGCTVV